MQRAHFDGLRLWLCNFTEVEEIHGDVKENQDDMSSIRKNKQIKAQLILLKTSPLCFRDPVTLKPLLLLP